MTYGGRGSYFDDPKDRERARKRSAPAAGGGSSGTRSDNDEEDNLLTRSISDVVGGLRDLVVPPLEKVGEAAGKLGFTAPTRQIGGNPNEGREGDGGSSSPPSPTPKPAESKEPTPAKQIEETGGDALNPPIQSPVDLSSPTGLRGSYSPSDTQPTPRGVNAAGLPSSVSSANQRISDLTAQALEGETPNVTGGTYAGVHTGQAGLDPLEAEEDWLFRRNRNRFGQSLGRL